MWSLASQRCPHCQEWKNAPFCQGCDVSIRSLLSWSSTSPHLLFRTHPWLVEETGSVVQGHILSLCLQCHRMPLAYTWYPNRGLSPAFLTPRQVPHITPHSVNLLTYSSLRWPGPPLSWTRLVKYHHVHVYIAIVVFYYFKKMQTLLEVNCKTVKFHMS